MPPHPRPGMATRLVAQSRQTDGGRRRVDHPSRRRAVPVSGCARFCGPLDQPAFDQRTQVGLVAAALEHRHGQRRRSGAALLFRHCPQSRCDGDHARHEPTGRRGRLRIPLLGARLQRAAALEPDALGQIAQRAPMGLVEPTQRQHRHRTGQRGQHWLGPDPEPRERRQLLAGLSPLRPGADTTRIALDGCAVLGPRRLQHDCTGAALAKPARSRATLRQSAADHHALWPMECRGTGLVGGGRHHAL